MLGATVAGSDTLGSLLTLVTDPVLFAARLEQLQQQMVDAEVSIKAAHAELAAAKKDRDDLALARKKLAQDLEVFDRESGQTRSAQSRQQTELDAMAARLKDKETGLKAAKDAHEASSAAAQVAVKAKAKELDELGTRLTKLSQQLDERTVSLNSRAEALASSEAELTLKHARLRAIINGEPAP